MKSLCLLDKRGSYLQNNINSVVVAMFFIDPINILGCRVVDVQHGSPIFMRN